MAVMLSDTLTGDVRCSAAAARVALATGGDARLGLADVLPEDHLDGVADLQQDVRRAAGIEQHVHDASTVDFDVAYLLHLRDGQLGLAVLVLGDSDGPEVEPLLRTGGGLVQCVHNRDHAFTRSGVLGLSVELTKTE